MLISEKRKFVFVEVPKTGTSSICKSLLSIDSDLVRNKLPVNNDTWIDVDTHITCASIKQVLGPRFEEFRVIGFFRDPVSLIRSKYFFYRHGRAVRESQLDGAPLLLKFRVMSAKILPLLVWSIIYPFKSGAHFISDDQGRLIVDELGDFDNLEEDFIRIFAKLGYSHDDLKLNVVNKSAYEGSGRVSQWACKMSVKIKLRRDARIYAAISRYRSDWRI